MIFFLYLCVCVIFASACEQHRTCRACIRDFGACAWCASDKITGPRCISGKSIPKEWCSGEIKNPESTKREIPVESKMTSNSEEIIQIKPQVIEMNLRPGRTLNFDFSYNAVEHYPVDLYFLYDALMELEFWQDQIKQTLEVIEWIQTITSNVNVGFGTFTNKNVLPYTKVKNETLFYSFKHGFNLSQDSEGFKKAADKVNIIKSPYIDVASGGFDALAQVIACKEIGWRSVSRKIVVYISDNYYLSANDGMAAGIINPYDGGCYMKNGIYTKEKEMDYPSPKMINKLASEQDMTLIFVINDLKTIYNPLKKIIKGLHVIYPKKTKSHMESLTSEVQKTYESITKTVKLKVDFDPKYENKINVIFEPDCNKVVCKVEQNKEMKFKGQITILEYFESDDIKVGISVAGINEKLSLDIKLINECNCTAGDDSLCNYGGIRRCGICECFSNRTGINCECPAMYTAANTNKTACIMANNTIECSGRGSCICGSCKCGAKRYSGQYCECDNEGCPKDHNGQLCGHGNCQCGECICKKGWEQTSQRTCSCDTSKDRCQTGAHECSNFGKCVCNECKCPEIICQWDVRSSQDHRCNPLPCQGCENRQCNLLAPYALNQIKSDTDCGNRVIVTSVKNLTNTQDSSWILCSDIRTDVRCYTSFIYKYDDENYGVHVIVQSEHNCAEMAYIYGGTCLGLIVLIGIITIIGWKILTVYRDRKEYLFFLNQYNENLKNFEEAKNPIFNSPNRTVSNPNYRRPSKFF